MFHAPTSHCGEDYTISSQCEGRRTNLALCTDGVVLIASFSHGGGGRDAGPLVLPRWGRT